METKIRLADEGLNNVREQIKKVEASDSKKQIKINIRKILTGLQRVLDVVGGAAEYDPRAKTAFTLFMSVLQLELNRKENEQEIVAVFYTMGSMIYVLRYLNEDVHRHEELKEQLDEQLKYICDTIHEFGAFANLYYTKYKKWITRYARATEFKGKIKGFDDDFHQYQKSLELILVVQMSGGQVEMSHELNAMRASIEIIIDRVAAPTSDSERKAVEVVQALGGEQILTSEDRLRDVVRNVLHDSVTSSTLQAIHGDLDVLLHQSSMSFQLKLDSAEMELNEAINKSTDKILRRMDEGPHELIEETQLKDIWKGNGWKFSVKCRTFCDALCNHYTQLFSRADTDEDQKVQWTIKILNKVANYPAIGEAIDEDASGFISVHELDHFIKRNEGLPTPVWFAFWAVGAQYLNFNYTSKIEDITDGLGGKCLKLKIDDEDLNDCIDAYVEMLKLVDFILDWSDLDDGADGLEELDDETTEELQEVADMLAQKKESFIEDNLKKIGYFVDDLSALPSLTGQAAFRIEQNITVLLFLILSEHENFIAGGLDSIPAQDFASKLQEMTLTLMALIVEFHDRFRSLQRSWRSQKLDIELQIQCYCGGLLNGWYQAYTKPDSPIVAFLKALEDDDDDQDNDSDDRTDAQGPSAPPAVSVDAKIDRLSDRVAALDTRLESIEGMLRQIMGFPAAAQREASPQRRNTEIQRRDNQANDHEGDWGAGDAPDADEDYGPRRQTPEEEAEDNNSDDDY
ncbi:hypothetical protein DFH08DRAFT_992863 [Mycena albidolilacea]|uniref:EF-hand domain-containing protein n=1 Tax=Mycena albidolilacea TaxID=1033008 RepID=A0AAD7A7Q1_9AGAR|nr:hypothetical protein DFH08DRAFT_992863 [Mycena albidolilacea]